MINIENSVVNGWEAAIRGMRNPMNSWEKSDSWFEDIFDDYDDCEAHNICGQWMWYDCAQKPAPGDDTMIGPNDHKLMMQLAKAGTEHSKYRRFITVTADITAPLYWWKEYDTYKVGTVANSCSTMHKIHAKEFTLEDFSREHIDPRFITVSENGKDYVNYFDSSQQQFKLSYLDVLRLTIEALNCARKKYLETKDKCYWWQMIHLLPTSYNQRRTVLLNYENLAAIYRQRKDHKLDEWHSFCDWIESLPFSEIITLKED